MLTRPTDTSTDTNSVIELLHIELVEVVEDGQGGGMRTKLNVAVQIN